MPICEHMGVYHFVSRTKTRDKIATMYDPQIIYDSKKDTLESVETDIYKCIIMLLDIYSDGNKTTII